MAISCIQFISSLLYIVDNIFETGKADTSGARGLNPDLMQVLFVLLFSVLIVRLYNNGVLIF